LRSTCELNPITLRRAA